MHGSGRRVENRTEIWDQGIPDIDDSEVIHSTDKRVRGKDGEVP